MKKLICTPFTYEMKSWWPTFRGAITGAYLGRKPASMATIRKFLRGNGAIGASKIKLGHTYESQWISK
jgi:hypothetical protein